MDIATKTVPQDKVKKKIQTQKPNPKGTLVTEQTAKRDHQEHQHPSIPTLDQLHHHQKITPPSTPPLVFTQKPT